MIARELVLLLYCMVFVLASVFHSTAQHNTARHNIHQSQAKICIVTRQRAVGGLGKSGGKVGI